MSTPLREYYDMIDNFDWSYMMSDDAGVYNRGSAEEAKIKRIRNESQAHADLYDAFYKHRWSGPHMGTEKLPKPERPA